MKVLYFGTVCDIEKYSKKLEACKIKPSVSTIVFENALLEGFKQNDINLEICSYPMIPIFPKSKFLVFGNVRETLSMGYECNWLNTVNLPVIKQWSRRFCGRKLLKKWLKNNKDDGVILTYSIPPFLVKDIIKYSQKYSVKTIAIIPDLLRDMYINEKKDSVITYIKNFYLKPALKVQDKYSGYVYLTESMCDVVAPDKPYMVMEGIASLPMDENSYEKAMPRAVMYAGMLHEKYGIINLIDAFETARMTDAELWLFGDGTAVEEIRKRAQVNPAIKYFGVVSREKVLEYEKKATLLVNPRDPNEVFTRYSFPSKTTEYMLSGTPVLTTMLKGIPSEYFDYVLFSTDNSVENLSDKLTEAFEMTNIELENLGKKARDFIINEKSAKKQAEKIISFIKEVK